jgi:hypothetical protein
MTSFQDAEPSVAVKYCARSDKTAPDDLAGGAQLKNSAVLL